VATVPSPDATPSQAAPARASSAGVYDDAIVKLFFTATVTWALVGMLLGVFIALELAWWPANAGIAQLTFGRLRPLHTNAVIFAFCGNICFTGIYYSMQRLLKTRMWNDTLSRLHFWGWQLIIVSAALTLPFGLTQSHEYAELIWPIDWAITIVWVIFAINFFGTIAVRKVDHLYVAIWFYMSFVITIAVLHIVNNLQIPATLTRSYPVFGGLTDALVQWWYGHNAVAFFLTTPFLGLMYYFLPRAVEKPVYSYRLSIIHFWSLVFLYIWAGPHHLLYSAVPEWAQTLGMVFSIMLIAPSWGGMINGLLTLRGAWDRVRTDPILKFMVVAVSFYGMATFEGPLLSIRAVNALGHYTNWIIGHVHSGALGWNGMLSFAILYWLYPRLFGRPLAKPEWVTTHFWIATTGIVLYTVSMWAGGLTEGLFWRAIDATTGQLRYPVWAYVVEKLAPFYWMRLAGGTLFFGGVVLMALNFIISARAARATTPATGDVLPARA
jgi:cytochrome c oxidase cbb3-type subunit I/II